MDFGDLSDNPFSFQRTKPQRPQRKAVASAAKILLLVAVCLAITIVIGGHSQKWLVHRLTDDFDALSSEQKQARLIQIAELGEPGIGPLVGTLADENIDVARTAYDLLRQSQNDWTVLDRGELQLRHGAMVDAIKTIAIQLPDDRTGWGTSLLQQTLMTTIQRDDDGSLALYRNATHAMKLLSLSDRSGPSILSDQPLDPLNPKRLIVRSKPLPVSAIDSVDPWTDWPPPRRTASATKVSSQFDKIDQDGTAQSVDTPTVYRSSSTRLQPVLTDKTVMLADVSQTHETAFQTSPIRSVTHLVDSPMATFDDHSVMHWLGSPHQVLREKAKLELVRRGFDGAAIALATQIASGDTKTRIELIDSIARSDQIDPRPWLLMMLSDESRNVKLRVISVLATMNDPTLNQRLRTHLIDERDPTVAARIRRALDLR